MSGLGKDWIGRPYPHSDVCFKALHRSSATGMTAWVYRRMAGNQPFWSNEPVLMGDFVPMTGWLQWTRMTDVKGEKIYEDDIVRFVMSGKWHQRQVVWNGCMWSLLWDEGPNPGPMRGRYEIVGNVHEGTFIGEVKRTA